MCTFFVHTRDCYHITQVGVKPVQCLVRLKMHRITSIDHNMFFIYFFLDFILVTIGLIDIIINVTDYFQH